MKKRGFVLTLDVTIAIIIVITILLLSNFFINKAKGPALSKIQVSKRGSDILVKLENKDVLDSFDETHIFNNLTFEQPTNYNMLLYFNNSNVNFTVGVNIPETAQVGSGRRVFARTQNGIINEYYIVRYFVWPK